MEFQEVIRARRSCRSFDPSAIAQEQLSAILDAGQWAPSPLNLQPWEFIVITDPEKKMRIREAGEEAQQRVVDSGGPGWVKKYSMGFVEEAPVMIAVVFDPAKGGLGQYFEQPYGALQAASACVQNMMLAAAEFGLGTLWFTFFDPDNVRPILNIPQDREIAAIVLIGKPKQPVDAPPRKAPKIHPEQYQAAE